MSLLAPDSAPSRPPHATKTLAPERDGEVDVVGCLAEGEPAHVAVVVGEAAVAEDGVGEEVGGDHRDAEAGLVERRRSEPMAASLSAASASKAKTSLSWKVMP